METYKERMANDFDNLKQEEMTVPEYIAKFTQLSHYATAYVSTEA